MRRALGAALALLVLATAPLWLANTYYVNILSQILIYAIFALALNVVVGYAGLVSLGHAGLLGVAAYAVAWLVAAGWGQLPAVVLALVVIIATSAVFAVLSLRATGIGFLMITLALGQILWGLA
jgi:branched-chain amino acid transport system permease protein